MLKMSKLAMSRSRTVTTVCNGNRQIRNDREGAKTYFLELMISTEVVEHERAEYVYIQLMHRFNESSDEDE